MTRIIEIIGSSPTTMGLAPYKHEVWTINHKTEMYARSDRHFELHKHTILTFNPEAKYCKYLIENQQKLWICEPRQEQDKEKFYNVRNEYLPEANLYPINAVVNLLGTYFKSTIDYLIALAVLENVDTINFYGVDMVSDEERWEQRRSLEHKIGFAQAKGVKINFDDGSPILKSNSMYGIEDKSNLCKHLNLKKLELSQRILKAKDNETQLVLSGALEYVNSLLNNWM